MIKYLTSNQIIAIHHKIIAQTSPDDALDIQSLKALNMLVEGSKKYSYHQALNPKLLLKAAYLFKNLIQAPVFLHANQRTAFTVLEIFLFLNGINLTVPTQEGIQFTQRVATHEVHETEIAEWLKNYMTHQS